MSKFKYAELFSGILGFGTALDMIGGECVFASEIDKYAQIASKALKPELNLHGDITAITAEDIPSHDLLVGGFPCQPFSLAGNRLGMDDMRGTLFFEVVRIAEQHRPKALLLENVKGLVNHAKGDTLSVMLHSLNEIGYIVDFIVLNSKYFGVPQSRERIFIVAIRDDLVDSNPWANVKGLQMLPKSKRRLQDEGIRSFNFDWPVQSAVTTRLRDILEPVVDEKYYISEEKTNKLLAQIIVNAYDVRPVLTPERIEKRQRGRRFKDNDEEAFTLTAQDRHGVLVGNRIRVLTSLETWRLQGFSDEAHETVKQAGVSDSQRYKQAGNAVTVNVIKAIGERLLTYL